MITGSGRRLLSKIAGIATPALLLIGSGCTAGPVPTTFGRPLPALRVVHWVGGAHACAIVTGDRWYQTFGGMLLVLDCHDGRELHRVNLGNSGGFGAAVDMTIVGERAWVVLRDESVVELELPFHEEPRIVRTIPAGVLGIQPRRLSVVAGQVYVSGVGGVTRLDGPTHLYACEADAGRVAAGEGGLITTIGRRVYAVADGRYLGSATDLQPVPPGALASPQIDTGRDDIALLFVRQGPSSATVGLMSADVRECDALNLSVIVPGEVNRVRLFDGRIWIVTDEGITAYALTGGRLGLRARLEIPHARDVAGLERNYVAVAGTFGRGIVRLHDDEHGPCGTFVHLHRQPGHLSRASCDGYYLLAECDDGCWQYEIGVGPPLPAELPAAEGIRPEAWEPATAATTVWGSAAISEDRLSVRIRTARGEARYADPNGCRLHCLAAVAGNIWIGHDGGITVLEISPGGGIHGGSAEGAVIVGGRMRLPGVVRYLFPLGKGEGAAFVCDSGLMGAAAFVLP